MILRLKRHWKPVVLLVAGAAIISGLYLFFVRPRDSDFQFLAGLSPTEVSLHTSREYDRDAGSLIITRFEIESEFRHLFQRVRDEVLRKKGAVEQEDVQYGYAKFKINRHVSIVLRDGLHDQSQSPADMPARGHGWVTVWIYDYREPTIRERLHNWLHSSRADGRE